MLYRLEDTHKVSYITKDNNETMLLSGIQKVMGEIYVNDLEHPESIVFIIGEFCFLFGKVNHDLKFDNDGFGRKRSAVIRGVGEFNDIEQYYYGN